MITFYRTVFRGRGGYQRLEMGLNDYLSSQRPEDQKQVDEDRAEMNARFFLRSIPELEFIRSLPGIGMIFLFFPPPLSFRWHHLTWILE